MTIALIPPSADMWPAPLLLLCYLLSCLDVHACMLLQDGTHFEIVKHMRYNVYVV